MFTKKPDKDSPLDMARGVPPLPPAVPATAPMAPRMVVGRPGDKPAKTRKFALYAGKTPFTGGN